MGASIPSHLQNYATVNICPADLLGDQRSDNLGLALYEGL